MPNSPYQIDESIARAAEAAGFTDVNRRRKVKVDPHILPPFYWTRKPDYHLIKKHLEDGIQIPGCLLTDEVEYTITKQETKCQS